MFKQHLLHEKKHLKNKRSSKSRICLEVRIDLQYLIPDIRNNINPLDIRIQNYR